MKTLRILMALAIIALIPSCASMARMQQEADEEAYALYCDALQTGNLCVEVDHINPMRGPSIYSSDGYYLSIKDGVVNSYLPFFGVTHSAPIYGIDPSGIEFKNFPVEYFDVKSNPAKGRYEWSFVAKSGNEPVYVTLTFWENGSAQILCKPQNRTTMNYSGFLKALPEKN